MDSCFRRNDGKKPDRGSAQLMVRPAMTEKGPGNDPGSISIGRKFLEIYQAIARRHIQEPAGGNIMVFRLKPENLEPGTTHAAPLYSSLPFLISSLSRSTIGAIRARCPGGTISAGMRRLGARSSAAGSSRPRT